MIDHITIATRNVEQSKAFYDAAFRPLGYAVAFGEADVFWAFRLEYSAGYYACFVLDPDGHNIEVMLEQTSNRQHHGSVRRVAPRSATEQTDDIKP